MRYTIGVPSYRGAERLLRFLTSVDHLEYPRKEFNVFIVDDGSPSRDVIHTIQVARNFGWPVLHWPKNVGLPGGYNALLQNATGQMLCMFDDDTLIPRNFLTVMDSLRAHNKFAVAGFISLPMDVERMCAVSADVPVAGDNHAPEFATQLAGQCFCIDLAQIQKSGDVWGPDFDTRYRYYIQDSDFCCNCMFLYGLPSYRFHYPRIPHLEHGTLGTCVELNAEKQVQPDIAAFVEKWKTTPERQEEVYAADLHLPDMTWMTPGGLKTGRPVYKNIPVSKEES